VHDKTRQVENDGKIKTIVVVVVDNVGIAA